MDPDLTDQVRALEAAMRLLENSAAERFSRLSERAGVLEKEIDLLGELCTRVTDLEIHNARFEREPPDETP